MKSNQVRKALITMFSPLVVWRVFAPAFSNHNQINNNLDYD